MRIQIEANHPFKHRYVGFDFGDSQLEMIKRVCHSPTKASAWFIVLDTNVVTSEALLVNA